MNNNRIAAIEARCEAATPGPWEANWLDDCFIEPRICMIPANGCYDYDKFEANSEFIAHAREDIPYLLSQIAERDGEIERLTHLNAKLIQSGVELGTEIATLKKQRFDLQIEIDRLREAQRWIPVTERLPEVGKCVLVRQTYHAFIGDHGEYEGITVGYLHQPTDKRRMPYFYYAAVSDYGDMVRAESICPGQEFVTHWMPLPTPPEEHHDND